MDIVRLVIILAMQILMIFGQGNIRERCKNRITGIFKGYHNGQFGSVDSEKNMCLPRMIGYNSVLLADPKKSFHEILPTFQSGASITGPFATLNFNDTDDVLIYYMLNNEERICFLYRDFVKEGLRSMNFKPEDLGVWYKDCHKYDRTSNKNGSPLIENTYKYNGITYDDKYKTTYVAASFGTSYHVYSIKNNEVKELEVKNLPDYRIDGIAFNKKHNINRYIVLYSKGDNSGTQFYQTVPKVTLSPNLNYDLRDAKHFIGCPVDPCIEGDITAVTYNNMGKNYIIRKNYYQYKFNAIGSVLSDAEEVSDLLSGIFFDPCAQTSSEILGFADGNGLVVGSTKKRNPFAQTPAATSGKNYDIKSVMFGISFHGDRITKDENKVTVLSTVTNYDDSSQAQYSVYQEYSYTCDRGSFRGAKYIGGGDLTGKISPILWNIIDAALYDESTNSIYIFRSDYHIKFDIETNKILEQMSNYDNLWKCESTFNNYDIKYWYKEKNITDIKSYHEYNVHFRKIKLSYENDNKTKGSRKTPTTESAPKAKRRAMVIILAAVISTLLLIALIAIIVIVLIRKKKAEKKLMKKMGKNKTLDNAPKETKYKKGKKAPTMTSSSSAGV